MKAKQTSVLRKILATIFLFAPFLTQCSPANEGGSAQIGVAAQALSASDVTRVTITITNPGGAQGFPITQNLVKFGNQWRGVIGQIPVGTHDFKAEGFDASNNLLYEGTQPAVVITKSNPAVVLINLQQKTPPNPFQNTIPDVDSFVASSNAIGPEETVDLAVTASDVDPGDTISYNWTAVDSLGQPAGTFVGGNTGSSAQW